MTQFSSFKIVNPAEEMILIKGENQTSSIYSYRVEGNLVYVIYKGNDKVYPYVEEENYKSPFVFIKKVACFPPFEKGT